jgi:hypothetical protein
LQKSLRHSLRETGLGVVDSLSVNPPRMFKLESKE